MSPPKAVVPDSHQEKNSLIQESRRSNGGGPKYDKDRSRKSTESTVRMKRKHAAGDDGPPPSKRIDRKIATPRVCIRPHIRLLT
jgi:hypothetical protein